MSGKKQLGKWAVLLFAAGVFALLFAWGSQIEKTGMTDLPATLLRLAAALPVSVCVLYALFERVLPRLEMRRDVEKKRFSALGAWLLIFCCYVPVFLVVYPGSFTYDSMKQVHQVASGEYSTILPLLHTLMIGFCLSFYKVFQSMEKCGVLYSLMQMLIMSGCFAMACQSISRSISRRAARIALLFFALHPVHMLFASNCTKDGLFGAFVVLFLALGLEMHEGNMSRVRKALFVFAGVMACMMRGNMLLALGVWVILILLFFRRQIRLAGYGLLVLALAAGGNALLSEATNASGGSFRELLSLPVQQLVRARVMKPESFSEAQKVLMDDMFEDWIEDMDGFYMTYIPSLADPVKNAVDNEKVRSNFGAYAKLWFEISRTCGGEYLDAFLNLMHATLYPYSTYPVVFPYADIGSGTALTAPYGLPPIVSPTRFDGIREWLTKDVFWTGMNEVPVVRYVFHLGWMTWLLLMSFFYDMYRGRRERVALLLAAVLVWATYLMGPVMYARYMYPTICSLPLFALRSKRNQENA